MPYLNTRKNKHFLKLSQTEIEILFLIKKGITSSQIAKLKNCSTRTIEKHRSNIIKKLNLKSSQNTLLLWISQNSDLFNT